MYITYSVAFEEYADGWEKWGGAGGNTPTAVVREAAWT